MSAKRVSMRKIHEVLRLYFEQHLTVRRIAQYAGVSRPTVDSYLLRFRQTGLSWPEAQELSQEELERRLFPPKPDVPAQQRGIPDWSAVQQELRRSHVTLALLWEEYKERHPDGFQYSWFCDQYRQWSGQVDLSMRQQHRLGEKLFVDYAGKTIFISDPSGGDGYAAQIFVAVLGASNYTYAEATRTQTLPDWISSHMRTFAFLGGVPQVVVPDNLRSGVTKAHRYEPDINPTYQDMACHYGIAVMPARARKPQDKGKVEVGVQIVERWILAALRHRQFFSLSEANQEIHRLIERLNQRPFRKLPGNRQQQFALEKEALQPLPVQPYTLALWKKVRVNIDYHIELERHYYSVPCRLVRKELDLRYTDNIIECYYRGQRIASHTRSYLPGKHTTVAEHMPKNHREYADWTPERILAWAAKSGPATVELITRLIAKRAYPPQAYRSALGILRLGKGYGNARLDAACCRALQLGTCNSRSIESILKRGLDSQSLPESTEETTTATHSHLRGPLYYQ